MIERRIGNKVWQCPSQDASEIELHDFLYGLVRLLKPEVVLETGCHKGDATVVIGRALKANGLGALVTCDIDQANAVKTCTRVTGEGLPVVVWHKDAMEVIKTVKGVELAFIDSGWERAKECAALQLAPHAYVLLHDAHTTEYPSFEAVKALGWTAMKFPTPLGLGLFEVIRCD